MTAYNDNVNVLASAIHSVLSVAKSRDPCECQLPTAPLLSARHTRSLFGSVSWSACATRLRALLRPLAALCHASRHTRWRFTIETQTNTASSRSLSLRRQRERESKSQLCVRVRVRVRVLEIIIIEPSSGIELKQCCRLVLHRKVTPERQQRKIVSIWRAPRLADTLEKVEIFTDQLENYLQTLFSILQFYHFWLIIEINRISAACFPCKPVVQVSNFRIPKRVRNPFEVSYLYDVAILLIARQLFYLLSELLFLKGN